MTECPDGLLRDLDIALVAKRHETEPAIVALAMISLATNYLAWAGGRYATAEILRSRASAVEFGEHSEPVHEPGHA